MTAQTIFPLLEECLSGTPTRDVLLAPGRATATSSDLWKAIKETSAFLSNHGIEEGDRVVVVLPNGPEMAVACLSVMSVAVAVPANPDQRKGEYGTIFERVKPSLLITLAGRDHPAKEAAVERNIPVCELHCLSDSPAGCFRLTAPVEFRSEKPLSFPGPDDPALILQTSGTTSRPKLVPLTHRNLLASAANLRHSLSLGPDDRVLHFLPMYHIGGIVDVLMAPLLAGGTVICAQTFSTPDFFRDLKQFRPTWTQAVPAMIHEILAAREAYSDLVADHGLNFLRSVSAPLPVSTLLEFERVFGIPVIEIFGMTETAGVITSNLLPPGQRKPGSVGVEAGCRVTIVDGEERTLASGQCGQVVVSGPSVMSGYLDEEEETERAITSAGLHTGDLGYLDAKGFLYLTGRVKDIINRGGEKVTPQEIDRVLMEYPTVLDAACFPVPDPVLGEEIAALVVMRPGSSLVREEILAFLRERLAFFKIPRILEEASSIPRQNGKLQRSKLPELLPAGGSVDRAQTEYAAPATPVAKLIAATWGKILQTDKVGTNDDFFLLGGDSLKAASFVNELQQKWGETVYVSSLFDFPSVAGFEAYLQRHYPLLVSRMLGGLLSPQIEDSPRVTSAMISDLRLRIAHPVPGAREDPPKNPSVVFVLSAPRSGSTLLRVMLGGNPGLFSPPELYLLSFDNLAERRDWYSGSQRFQLEGNLRALMELRRESIEGVREFMNELEARNCSTSEYYSILQSGLGDRSLVDKTPAYAIDTGTLRRAEQYFESPLYIHLTRHPYGMIRSFEEAKLEQLWYPRLVGNYASGPDALPYSRRQLAEMIWLILNENILTFLREIPEQRKFELRFEDLVNDPEREMRSLCEKMGLAYDAGMIDPQSDQKRLMTDGIHEASRMIGDPKFHQHRKIDSAVAGQWKHAYTTDFLSNESVDLARKLGYTEMLADFSGREEFEL